MPEERDWSRAEYLDIVGSLETGTMPTVVVNSPLDSRFAYTRESRRAHWPTVTVVMPAHNEARNLPYALRDLPNFVTEVILVDGGSTDATVALAKVLWPGIIVIQQPGRGKGDALRTGLAQSHGDIVVLMDADGSTHPQEIELFVAVLVSGNADYVKGSRYLSGGGSEDFTLVRSVGNRLLNKCANVLYHTRFTDFCYGFNAFWRECIPIIPIECDGFEVEAQLNCRAVRSKLRIIEVPSIERRRRHGASHLSPLRDGWRILRIILTERHWQPSKRIVPDESLSEKKRASGQRVTTPQPNRRHSGGQVSGEQPADPLRRPNVGRDVARGRDTLPY